MFNLGKMIKYRIKGPYRDQFTEWQKGEYLGCFHNGIMGILREDGCVDKVDMAYIQIKKYIANEPEEGGL